jgi:hypothetical protein
MNKKIFRADRFFSLKNLFIFGIIIIMSSCLSIKPGDVKSGNNLYETFFVGNEGTQYFIKPLTFIDGNKNRLILDFTFRYKDKIKDSVVINMSFLDSEIYRNIDSLKMTNNSVSIVLKDIKCLFADRSQKEFNSRFSTKGSLVDITKLFEQNDWLLIAYKRNDLCKYKTSKNTGEKINKLRYGIFMLFQ